MLVRRTAENRVSDEQRQQHIACVRRLEEVVFDVLKLVIEP